MMRFVHDYMVQRCLHISNCITAFSRIYFITVWLIVHISLHILVEGRNWASTSTSSRGSSRALRICAWPKKFERGEKNSLF